MKKPGALLTLVSVLAVFAAISCSSGTTNGPDAGASPSATTTSSGTPASTGNGTSVFDAPEYAAATARSLAQTASPQAQGIFVSGIGRVNIAPDLALLRLGIEVTDQSISVAHARAAGAMLAVSNAVKATGVEDKDIQTQRFSIQPMYRWEEVVSDRGFRTNEQVLDGYQVTNSVVVKVRDLDAVSTIVDGVAKAGGDDVRIDGISFTVEDSTDAKAQARAAAMRDAVSRAQQLATAAGISLGKPISITESGGFQDPISSFSDRSMGLAAAESASVSTPIEAGELEVVVNVSAVFAIP
ncbi:MAG: SIMPL domain-containing protein [Chloroflexi bacterium]|nr:SIMPL domain-containing protein [Chloroflexota bacterium]